MRYPLPLLAEFITVGDDSVSIKTAIWQQMRASDLVEIKSLASQRLENYYETVK